MLSKVIFIAGLLFVLTPWSSPPIALAIGIAFGLLLTHPFRAQSQKLSKILLQVSVVGLGFGMDLLQVAHAGASGFVYTAAGIAFALLLGTLLGRAFGVPRTDAFLISVGTAICGGSAIAAVGPITDATDEQMSVSLGTIFVLNSVALLLFPPIGIALGLTQSQFGLWAALAIHDTSSVVGAAAKYGAIALAIGTTVKLARALWIVPVSFGTAVVRKRGVKVKLPWFIVFFVAAAALNTMLPAAHEAFGLVSAAAKIGLSVTLFLIGSNLSRESLKRVGARPLLLGVSLWLIVASVTLALIRANVIHM